MPLDSDPMQRSRRSPQMDRAWSVAIGGGLCAAVSQGAIILYCFGVFVPAVAKTFGAAPSVIGASISPALIFMSALFPFVGHAIDRYGARRIGLAAFPLFAIAISFVATAQSSLMFMLLLLGASIVGTPTNPSSWVPTVSQWFETRRGLGLGLFTATTGVGLVVMPMLSAALIERVGWRSAYVGLGLVSAVVGLTSLLFMVRDPPRPAPQIAADGADSESSTAGLTLRVAWRGYPIYALLGAFFLLGTTVGSLSVHLPSFLNAHGVTTRLASVALAAFGFSSLFGRIVIGFILDRVFAPWISAVLFCLPAFAYLSLIINPTYASALFAAVVVGLALGGELADCGYLVGAAFGRREYAKFVGLLLFAYASGQGAGPGIVGLMAHAAGENYTAGFIVLSVASVFASLLMLSLGRAHLPYYPATTGVWYGPRNPEPVGPPLAN